MAQGLSDAYYKRYLDRLQQKPARSKRSPKVMEIDGMDSEMVRRFPYSSLKLLGAIQIGIGVVVIILGIVDLFLFLYVSSDYGSDSLSAITIASVPIWCGLWFLVTGAMGTCMSMDQKTTLSYFKATFMCLSLLCAILFGPGLCAVEIYIVIERTDKTSEAYEWLIPLTVTFFAFIEVVFAVITASICCCCSPLDQAKVRVLYAKDVEEIDEKPRLETPEIFYASSAKMERNQRAPVTTRHIYADATGNGNRRSDRNGRSDNYDNKRGEDYDSGREEPVRESKPTTQPRVEMMGDSPEVTHRSRPPTYDPNGQYAQLKRMTFPGEVGY